jgi:prepilin-type N-terminal cleavage/methylation domain-containing protein
MSNAKRDPRAFTLIELLVVIAIISLLVSILIPSIQNAKRIARLLLCRTRIVAIMKAANLYAGDEDGYAPFNNYDGGKEWSRWPGPGWLYDAPTGRNVRDLSDDDLVELPKTSALWGKYLSDLDIYRCPEDRGPYRDDWPVRKMTSYSMNGALSAYGSGRAPVPTFPIGRMRARAIILWETDDKDATYWYWNDGGNRPDEGLTRRHRDGASVGMLDGSAEWITRGEYDNEEEAGPGRLWCEPGHPTGGKRAD